MSCLRNLIFQEREVNPERDFVTVAVSVVGRRVSGRNFDFNDFLLPLVEVGDLRPFLKRGKVTEPLTEDYGRFGG